MFKSAHSKAQHFQLWEFLVTKVEMNHIQHLFTTVQNLTIHKDSSAQQK